MRFLYGVTLARDTAPLLAAIPLIKRNTRPAQVYARRELEALLTAPRQPRDRAFLMTVYAAGLRLSEATYLKTTDIDSPRCMLNAGASMPNAPGAARNKSVRTGSSHSPHASSNRRIVPLDQSRRTVTFTYRDYRHGSKVEKLTLSAVEFIRRFSWHILPSGLVRIRHYGILANNRRHRDIPRARILLQRKNRPTPEPKPPALPKPLPSRRCPHCGRQALRWIGFLDAQGRTHLHTWPLIWDSS